jgi:flagellar motor switch protein FliN/FliY
MEKQLFSPMAIDALGEMMNISLGSSATAVSNMLDHRVDITTPKVTVVALDDFTLGELDPALGIEIKYVEGLEGSNIMLLRRNDVKVIVDILLGTEMPEEEFELNELTISAVCELMNQMMGAASTAMSDFLGYPVNISTPEPFELNDVEKFKEEHLPTHKDQLVVIRFKLTIEDALESEFMNVISVDLAKELLAGLGLEDEVDDSASPPPGASAPEPAHEAEPAHETPPVSAQPPAPAASEKSSGDSGGGKMSQEEIEKLMAGMLDTEPEEPAAPEPPAAQAPPAAPNPPAAQPSPAPVSVPVGAPTAPPGSASASSPAAAGAPAANPYPYPYPYPYPDPATGAAYGNGYPGYPPMYAQQPAAQPQPKVINTQPAVMQQFSAPEALGEEQAQNLDLIMEVPLQVSVEIGRTRRKVQEILEYSKGSLVVLDKLAGDQVDLFVNGKCIARGDVVVVEDNFGVRITEIVQKPTVKEIVKK